MFRKEVTPNLLYWPKRLEIRQSGSINNLKGGVTPLTIVMQKRKKKKIEMFRGMHVSPIHFLSLFGPSSTVMFTTMVDLCSCCKFQFSVTNLTFSVNIFGGL